jgi:hypothetical protein
LAGGEGNEKGHWEAIDAISLNDKMLESAGSSHEDWGEINPDWKSSAIRSQMVQKASTILLDHVRIGPLFAIKDPRMCRLADVWLEAANVAEVDPLIIVMLRNPAEVIASLGARDLMGEGYAELLWLRHVLDAERYSRGQKRLFFRYDQLIDDFQSLIARVKEKLGISLPRNTPKVHAEISNFLSLALRHHHADHASVLDDLTRSLWLRQTFRIMLQWSENGENAADYALLDDVRTELNRSHAVFARLLLTSDMTGEVGSGPRLRDELKSLKQQVGDKTEALRIATEVAESERTSAKQTEAELSGEIENLRGALVVSESALSAAQQARLDAEERYAEVFGELQKQELENSALSGEIENLRGALVVSESALSAAQQARLDAEERYAEVFGELQNLKLDNAELSGRVSSLQSGMLQRQEELSQLLAQFHEAERQRVFAEFECEQARKQQSVSEENVEHAREELLKLKSKLVDEQKIAGHRLDSLTSDLAKVTIMLKEQEEATDQAARRASLHLEDVQRLSEKVSKLETAACEAEATRDDGERQLATRFDELARLTAILSEESCRADASKGHLEWLLEARKLEQGFPIWWSVMPDAWQRKRIHRRYLRAGLFDVSAYLELYPDVAAHGMDPIHHYILHGMEEGRTCTLPS